MLGTAQLKWLKKTPRNHTFTVFCTNVPITPKASLAQRTRDGFDSERQQSEYIAEEKIQSRNYQPTDTA